MHSFWRTMHPPRQKKKNFVLPWVFCPLAPRERGKSLCWSGWTKRSAGLIGLGNGKWNLRFRITSGSYDFHGILLYPMGFHGFHWNCSWDFIDFTIQQICWGFCEELFASSNWNSWRLFPCWYLLRCILIHRKSHEVRIPNILKEQGWFSHSVRIVHTGHQHVLMCWNITMTCIRASSNGSLKQLRSGSIRNTCCCYVHA